MGPAAENRISHWQLDTSMITGWGHSCLDMFTLVYPATFCLWGGPRSRERNVFAAHKTLLYAEVGMLHENGQRY